MLTVSCTIIAGESWEVGLLEPLVVAIQGPHHTRPGLLEHKVALPGALYLLAWLVQENGDDTEEGEGLKKRN